MGHDYNAKMGHSILRYKVRLYDRHFSWLVITRELYTKVVSHFFAVLKQEKQLLELSDFPLLRALETICIGTREMKKNGEPPQYPLPEHLKVPLYFRRSATNAAIDLARKKAAVQAFSEDISENELRHIPMVLYQGMYRGFEESTIELKLYDGSRWRWVTYPFTGRKFPEDAVRLSPILFLDKKTAWLEVPLSFSVSDIRTVKERMQEEGQIMAVAFPDVDVMAAAVVLQKDGEELEYRMFRGGKQKEHQRRKLLLQLAKSKESRNRGQSTYREQYSGNEGLQENRKLYQKLEDINNYYTHKISRELLNYCQEKNIKVIVVPNYENSIEDYRKQCNSDVYRWLGRGIIKKLKYKAFQQGIVVTSIRPYHISDRCSQCGEEIVYSCKEKTVSQNLKSDSFFTCPNGHKGSVVLNTARNVGKRFLSYVQ